MLHLGKREATPRDTDFRFAALRAGIALPAVPYRFGHGTLYLDWGMYGNGPDSTVGPGFSGCGDCVFAGAAHEHRMYNKVVHRREVPFDGRTVVADYSAVTGYVVGDDSTDQGTYVHDALAYRRRTGIADSLGQRHKIGAYVALDPKSWEHLREATYIFGAVGMGFEFPASAWGQLDGGVPWDVVEGDDGGIDGGHYVPVVGAASSTKVACVTWGQRQALTRAFYERYNDEAWVYITPEELHHDRTGLHGFDIAQLNGWLAQLQQ